MKVKMKKKAPKVIAPVKRPLPNMFAGAQVIEGGGVTSKEMAELDDKHACDEFLTSKDGVFLVIEDNALQDLDDQVSVRLFTNEQRAIRYARGRSTGNVDHRVLRVTDQTLVVATLNELP